MLYILHNARERHGKRFFFCLDEARVIENAVHLFECAIAALASRFEKLAVCVDQVFGVDHIQRGDDAVQGGPHFVAHYRKEAALGFGGLFGFVAGCFQLGLGFEALGDVGQVDNVDIFVFGVFLPDA